MGQVNNPSRSDIILTATDRLVARNANGGLAPAAQHVILFGASAGANASINDFIAMGNLTASGGISDTPDLDGTIALGSGAAQALTINGTGAPVANSAVIVIGRNALQALVFGGSSIVVGDKALPLLVQTTAQPLARSIVLGDNVGANILGNGGQAFDEAIVIGYHAFNRNNGIDTFQRGISRSVVIGSEALGNFTNLGVSNLVGNVIIGAGAGLGYDQNGAGSGDVVIIGRDAGATNTGSRSVIIGAVAVVGTASDCVVIGAAANSTQNRNVVIGADASVATVAVDTVCIGAQATGQGNNCVYLGASPHVLTGNRNIAIGFAAGNGETAANTDRFIVESVVTGTRRALLYGDSSVGNLVVGNSIPGTNRDLPGTNILKLLAGTKTGSPVGGGMFYVVAADAHALHWVDSGGVDSVLSPGTGQLAKSTTAYTNNAAAAAATILNSPTAGNPTKWIPINDNGTIRNIPAW